MFVSSCFLKIDLIFWLGFSDPFLSGCLRGFCESYSYFPEHILVSHIVVIKLYDFKILNFSKASGINPSAPITFSITIIFTFHSCFSSLTRSRYLSISRQHVHFLLLSEGSEFIPFICFSGQVIRFHLAIPEKCTCHILLDQFWFVHLPFGSDAFWINSSILPVVSLFSLFNISKAHFQCQNLFLYSGCIFLFFASGSLVLFHFCK